MAGSGDDVVINLTAVDNVSPVLRQVSQAMGAFSGDATRMVSSLAQLGAVALPIMAIGGAFIYAGQQAAMVQQNVANLNAVLHATSEQLAAIRNNGLALSQATQFTDAQILASQRQLAKGGATPADLAQGGSQGVTGATLNLAAATQSTPTAAATSMTTASSAFQIPIQDAAKTATILASAVDSSVGSLANQATALKQVGVVAKAAGFDVKETVTTIADLQNNGMLNDSGTGLKTFLSRIEAPSGAAKKQIDDLGLSFYDLQGHLKPIPELFDEIHTKMMGLDQQTANDALTKIFGLRGVRVADVALEQGSSGYIDTAQSMAEKGDASEIAARKLDTFQGSASKAASSLNVLAVQFGTVLLPGMKSFADLTEHTANMLSQLNNAATIVPQVAVGVAAIAGIAKFGSFVDNRQEATKTAQQSKLDQANQERIASTADYNNAVVAAEFDADSKIATAHANMTKGLQEIDQQRYDAWIALEAKTVDAVNAAEAKQLQSVQSITAAYMESIDKIDRAQAAASADNIARMQADADRQRALLSVGQEEQTAKAAIPSGGYLSSTQQMEASQQIERDSLEKRLVVQQDYETKVDQIRLAGIERQKNELAIASQNAIDQKEAEGRATLTAVEVNQAQQEDALVASFAKQQQIVEAGYAEMVAKTEAGLANRTGVGPAFLQGPTLSGKPIPNPDMVSGTISDEAKAIKVPAGVTLTAGAVAADAGMLASLKTKSAAVIGTVMAAAGEFVVPALIALTVVEMIIKPIDQAIIDRAVKNDSQLQSIDANVNSITANRGQSYADQVANTAQSRQDIQKEIDDRTAALKKEEDARSFGLPVVGGLDQAIRGVTGIQPADIGEQRKAIADLQQQLVSLDQQSKKTDLLPAAAMSKANDTLTVLLTQVDSGKLSVDDFTAAWATAGKEVGEDTVSQLEKQGVAQDKANQLIATGIDLAKQHAKALEDARQQAQADYAVNARGAMDAVALGATPDMADVANFGQHSDQSAATKVEIADAKKEIADLKTAWTSAQTAINSIDISKGIDAFGKQADAIDLANRSLANLGQSNPALQELGRIADTFKTITDAEKQATAAMDGYNLTLQQSQGYASQVTKIQQEFNTALAEAQRRQAAGISTPQDDYLISHRADIAGNLQNQQTGLSEHMVLDVIGTVQNLPDFVTLDKTARDIVAAFPGGAINLVATITSDAKTARQQIEDILKPDIHINVIADVSQFDPAIINAVSKYGAATQGGTYNDNGGGGNASAPPPSAVNTAFNSYTQTPGNSNPLTYHDLNPDQYATIVAQSTGGKSSPFTDPEVRDALLAAAKEGNVDPRLMLDMTRYENNDATNISPTMLGIHNYGGIKYDPNNPLEGKGPVSPEKDNYAAFDSAKDFFKTLAANLSTGEYKNDFNQGNTEGIFNRYQAGNKPPSQDQANSTMNRNNTYWDWVQRFPAGANGGLGAGGVVTGAEGGGSGGVASDTMVDGVAAGVRAQIVQKALSQVDQAKMVGYCEQWVEETVQGITGKRGATGTNEASASTAFAHGQAMGLETHNPQPGDLVYYPSASGGDGHVAIYMGGGMQVSTADQGSMTGKDAQIHTEKVGDNARYLSVGAGGVNYGVGDPGNRGNATGGTALLADPNYYTDGKKLYPVLGGDGMGIPGTFNAANGSTPNIPTIDGTKNGSQYLLPPNILADTGGFPASIAGQFSHMNPLDINQSLKMFQPTVQTLTQQYDAASLAKNGTLTQPDQENNRNAAIQRGLELQNAEDQVLQDQRTHTGDIVKDMQAVADLGGPIGQSLTAQLTLYGEIQAATDKQKADQADLKDMEAARALVTAQNAADDKQTALDRKAADLQDAMTQRGQQRTDTRDQWKVADQRQLAQDTWTIEKNNLQDKTEAENKLWTAEQRHYEDTTRNLQQQGTLQQRVLQDEQTALDRNHAAAVGQTKAIEQMLSAQASYANSTGQSNVSAVQLATMRGNEKLTGDQYTKQQQTLADAVIQQQRLASDALFNMQTQQLVQQRAHEDTLKRISDETTAEGRTEQAAQRRWQEEDKNIQRAQTKTSWYWQDVQSQNQATRDMIDQQTARDRLTQQQDYDKKHTDQQNLITQDGEHVTKLQAAETAIGGIASEFQGMVPNVKNVADTLLAASGGGTGVAAGATAPPRRLGGYAGGTPNAEAGQHTVAEYGPELVFKGGEQVLSTQLLSQILRQPALASSSPSSGGGTNVTLNVNGGGMDTQALDELRAETQALVDRKVSESEARTNASAQLRDRGGMRG